MSRVRAKEALGQLEEFVNQPHVGRQLGDAGNGPALVRNMRHEVIQPGLIGLG